MMRILLALLTSACRFLGTAGNPFNLPLSNANFERGFNRFYDYRLAQSLSKIYKRWAPCSPASLYSGLPAHSLRSLMFGCEF